MLTWVSRILSIVVVLSLVVREWPNGLAVFSTVLYSCFACVLIWFPQEVDDFTFGTTRFGNKIDSHTPAFLIVAVGWVLLGVHAASSFWPGWLGRLFGM